VRFPSRSGLDLPGLLALALTGAAALFQLSRAIGSELPFLRDVLRQPRSVARAWPELQGSYAGDALRVAAVAIPESGPLCVDARGSTDPLLAHYQASYALYPRAVHECSADEAAPYRIRAYIPAVELARWRASASAENILLVASSPGQTGTGDAVGSLVVAVPPARFRRFVRPAPEPRLDSVALNAPSGNALSGSLMGDGFRPGDRLVVDGNVIVGTAYGGPSWITFEVPLGALAPTEHRAAVVRPSGEASSEVPFSVVAASPPAVAPPTLAADLAAPELAAVTDVRIASLQAGGPPQVIGSVLGTAFDPADLVLVDGRAVPTAFGNREWMTFSFPASGAPRRFRVTVERPGTELRSRTLEVRLPR
jgi:hypothetical protein